MPTTPFPHRWLTGRVELKAVVVVVTGLGVLVGLSTVAPMTIGLDEFDNEWYENPLRPDLNANNDIGGEIDTAAVEFGSVTSWQRLAMSPSPRRIAGISPTLADADRPTDPHPYFGVDKLAFGQADPPNASFDYEPRQPVVGETVTFDGRDSFDSDGEIVEYRWDLNDDGDTDRQVARIDVEFDEPGTYPITLEVVDDNGATDSVTREVTVLDGPVAQCAVESTHVEPGEQVVIDASDSTANLIRFDIDGDGEFDRTNEDDFREVVAYPDSRQYTPVVRAVIRHHFDTRRCPTITVNLPPSASVEPVGGTEPTVGDRVNFDASGSVDPDGEIVRYRWYIGEASTPAQNSTSPSFSHTVDSAGMFQVRVEVIDDDGAVADAQRSIRVGGGTIPGADLAIAGLGGIAGLWILSQVAAIARWIGRTIRRWLDGNNQTNDNDGDNQVPTPEIRWHPEKPAPGHPVLFDGSLSVDPDPNDQIVAFRWSIDDKYVRTPRFVHAFLKAGTYDVSLEVRNSRGETGRETKSITVEESAGELVLDRVHPDSPGNDHENLRAEYLVFKNAGDETLALGGWTVHDGAEAEDRVTAGDHTFTFPDGTEVAACSTVTLHTGAKPDHGEADAGPPGSLHLYWAKRWPVWNNDEDIIVVEADDGSPVLVSRYTRTGDEYELDALEFEILEDWFPDVIVSPRGNTPLLSIDVSLGIRSVILGVAGFIASAFFLRGAAAFVRAWAVITGFLLPAIGAWAVSPTLPRVTHSIEPIIPLVLTAGSLLVLLVSGTGLVVQRAISAGWSMITG